MVSLSFARRFWIVFLTLFTAMMFIAWFTYTHAH